MDDRRAPADHRETSAARRQSWFGLKRLVKRVLSLRVPHAILRVVVGLAPSLRTGRLPAPAALREVHGRVDGASFVMLHPDRCEIAKELYWGHGRRPAPADAFALDVVSRLGRGADVFLDIGAYTGVFTLATTAVNPTLTAHAFEIVPAVADVLRENLARNGVDDRVTAHLEGVGEAGATMRVPSGEGGSALPSFYSSRLTFRDGVTVGFRSLDSVGEWLEAGAGVVMKIDVEGTEDAIFRHGQGFLQAFGPDILCEVLPGADGSELERLLGPGGLRIYAVGGHRLVAEPRLVPTPRVRDWLFTPRDASSLRELGIPVRHGA